MSTTYVNGSSALFSYGTSGLATANAPVGYVFIHWETTGNVGVSSTTDNPTTVTVVGDGTLKAVFAQIMCNVTFVTVPSGTISFLSTTYVNGSSALFAYGTVASATANGPVGYVFDHWETTGNVGVSSTTANPTMVTVTCGGVLKALFTQFSPSSASISPTSAKIKIGENVTFTSSVSGGSLPYSYQWYLDGSAVSGATSPAWTFAPTSLQPIGNYTVYMIVTDSLLYTAQSNSAIVSVAPALTVQISPLSASALVGQPITFTATVSGGYPPYSYQWYLDDNPVSGASSSSWTFVPTTAGIYYVCLKVTDTTDNTAQSDTARIVATPVPVGGYSVSLSVSLSKGTSESKEALYAMFVTFFGIVLTLKKRTKKPLR